MDRASALPFPSSRTLAGWCKQLHTLPPRSLWVGHCFVHRVEAAVRVQRQVPLDPLTRHLLAALALAPAAKTCPLADCVEPLVGRLHLPPAVLRGSLRALAEAGLATNDPARGWALSGAGEAALAAGSTSHNGEARLVFPFVERCDAAGRRVAGPEFLPLGDSPAAPWTVAEADAFDPARLQQTLAAPADWKAAHGFPSEVLPLEDANPSAAWRRVLLDRPERLTLVLADAEAAGWVGFAAAASWHVDERRPILRTAELPWPELALPPSTEETARAWRVWCQQRNLPAGEVDECRLHVASDKLLVHAPERLIQRLQSARSDAVRGDAWLLLGDGHFRRAVAIELARA